MRISNLQSPISITLILLLATFLRFYRIDAQSLWHDEGNSYQMTLKSADRIIGDAAADIHPPLYYFLLSAWRAVAGKSEFALRGLSAFFGIILVTLVYKIGKKSFDETAALASAFFAAIHPALIYYSQEMRMYELVAMIGAGSWLLVIGNWRGEARSWRLEVRGWKLEVGSWIVTAAVIAAGLYTHYSFAFIIIAINICILIRITHHASRITLNYQLLITWLAPQILALLLYLPWLPIAFRQLTTWPAARENLPILESLLGVTRWLTLGHTMDADLAIPALIGLAALIGLGMYRTSVTTDKVHVGGLRFVLPRFQSPVMAIALWLLVPSTLTVIFGLFSVAFSKFLIIAVPAMCLMLGVGAAGLFAPKVGDDVSLRWIIMRGSTSRAVAIIALAGGMLVTLTMTLALTNLYSNPLYARADYRGIAQFLNRVSREGDVILTNSPSQEEVFRYYYTQQNVIPVARSRPLNVPEQIAELETISKTYKRIFVLYWGDEQADPKKVIESWLNEKTFKAYDQWYGDARLAAYAVNQTAGTMNQKVNARFGDRIRLEGYSINDSSFAAGDILQLTLFWNPQSLISNRYKIFVHLSGDPDSPPVAQHDGEPVGGLVLTTMWKPNEIVRDNHGVFLPLDLPRGEYKLAVGLYDVNTGERLTLADGHDKLFLDSIVVK
ncbi:MAG: glycosyltransferase family 39 protein [Chloroflexi bacterium]|nr:glycosyltransferase family 39 protein [Chloroflexota bacterium]